MNLIADFGKLMIALLYMGVAIAIGGALLTSENIVFILIGALILGYFIGGGWLLFKGLTKQDLEFKEFVIACFVGVIIALFGRILFYR